MKDKVLTSVAIVALTLGAAVHAPADPALRSVAVGRQTPLPTTPGSTATFLVTVTRTGFGSLNAYLNATGLPEGTTARFTPSILRFTDRSPSSKVVTLTVTTPASTPPGSYNFTVTARHGASPTVVRQNGTLVLGLYQGVPENPIITSIVKQADGSIKLTGVAGPAQPVLIQATADLSLPDWQTIGATTAGVNGILEFIDIDAATLPCRFYRLAAEAVSALDAMQIAPEAVPQL